MGLNAESVTLARMKTTPFSEALAINGKNSGMPEF
jgi:hypothetical protein